MPFVEGLKYGLFLMLLIGPSFFYMIGVGIREGFVKAFGFAIGIMISDVALILIIYLGLSQFFETEWFNRFFSLTAGVVLVVIGIQYLMMSGKEAQFDKRQNNLHKTFPAYIIKGVAINLINPFSIMLWIGVLGNVALRKGYEGDDFYYFAGGLVLTILLMDTLKAYAANGLSKILNERNMRRLDKALGVVFLILSVRFFYFFVMQCI